jgi:hypothetical protein
MTDDNTWVSNISAVDGHVNDVQLRSGPRRSVRNQCARQRGNLERPAVNPLRRRRRLTTALMTWIWKSRRLYLNRAQPRLKKGGIHRPPAKIRRAVSAARHRCPHWAARRRRVKRPFVWVSTESFVASARIVSSRYAVCSCVFADVRVRCLQVGPYQHLLCQSCRMIQMRFKMVRACCGHLVDLLVLTFLPVITDTPTRSSKAVRGGCSSSFRYSGRIADSG